MGRDISSQGISALQALKLGALRSLCLSNNSIGPEGCRSIAIFMESSGAPLEHLDLTNNIICQGLPKKDMPPESNRNPRTGYYGSYETDLQGLGAFLAVARQHPTLQSFDLRGNFLNLEAGRMLSEAVLENVNLVTVCGIPLHELRGGCVEELVHKNPDSFIDSFRNTPALFLGTGGVELLLELLLYFPQPNLKILSLKNQALASDSEGVVRLFEKLGNVAAAAEGLEILDNWFLGLRR